MTRLAEMRYIFFFVVERSHDGLRNHQCHARHAAHWRRDRRLDARQAAQQPPGRGAAPGAGGASGPVLSRSAARRGRPQGAAILATCTFTRTRPVRRGMPRSFPSMPTPIPSALPENIGIPTSHVTRSRRWAAFFTCTPCRLSAEITLFASQYAAYDALSSRMKDSGDHIYHATNVLGGARRP